MVFSSCCSRNRKTRVGGCENLGSRLYFLVRKKGKSKPMLLQKVLKKFSRVRHSSNITTVFCVMFKEKYLVFELF